MSKEDLEEVEQILDAQIRTINGNDSVLSKRTGGTFSLVMLRDRVRNELMTLIKRPVTA